MAYADATDVNVWLDGNKTSVTNGTMVTEADTADRIVRGYLTGRIDSTTLNSWTTPSATPEIIREISGQFVAAFVYRRQYSEDTSDEVSGYGQKMYDEAFAKLMAVVNGEIDIVGLPVGTVLAGESNLKPADFYPNETTVGTTQDRRFTWDQEF